MIDNDIIEKAMNRNDHVCCKRYNIIVTGCSRYFICKSEGLDSCFKLYPEPSRYKVSSIENRLKINTVSDKQRVVTIGLTRR